MNAPFKLDGMPDTAFAAAYLRALVRKVKTTDPNIAITVPSGIATTGEIERLLANLNIIRRNAETITR